MEDYKKYLAERLFTEDKMVTYRILSRALKVHVDVAKAYVPSTLFVPRTPQCFRAPTNR